MKDLNDLAEALDSYFQVENKATRKGLEIAVIPDSEERPIVVILHNDGTWEIEQTLENMKADDTFALEMANLGM